MSTAFQNNRPVLVDSELPAQTPVKEGNALITNGATASWNNILAMIGTKSGQVTPTTLLNTVLPSQAGNATKVLSTDGSNAAWAPATAGPIGYTGSRGVQGPIGYTGSAGVVTAGGVGSLTHTVSYNMGTYNPPALPGTWVMVVGDLHHNSDCLFDVFNAD